MNAFSNDELRLVTGKLSVDVDFKTRCNETFSVAGACGDIDDCASFKLSVVQK